VTTSSVEVLTTEPFDESGSDAVAPPPDTQDLATDRSYASSNVGASPTTAAKSPVRRIVSAVPGQVAQVAANVAHKGDSPKTRTIAAVVFFDICLWGWWASARQPVPGTPQAGRPYRTLYDGAVAAPTRRRSAASREGKPPPLR
jgi:hypothetical protein